MRFSWWRFTQPAKASTRKCRAWGMAGGYMAQTRPSPTLSRGFTRLGRFLAPYGVRCVAVASVASAYPPLVAAGRVVGRTVSTRKLSGRGTSKENAHVRNRRGWWPRSRLRARRRSAGACGARTAAPPDGEIKIASETIHGDTNGMGRHMPAVSHAVGQVLQRRRRRPDAMPNEPDQGFAISRATQFRRGGGDMTRCRIHERCPAEPAAGWV